MDYQEENYLMLSGIQHFSFCKRQWALIHIEQQWEENVRTVEGELMHKRAHDINLVEKSKDILTVHALPISSKKMGVSGECDIVEFRKVQEGIQLHGHRGYYQVYPVEYKRGNPKVTEIDRLQLVAQIMCLEEMFQTEIPKGAIFYGEIRRREEVEATQQLRDLVRISFEQMHQLYERGYTPKVKWSKSCNACSLKEICLPKIGKKKDVRAYIDAALSDESD